MSQQVRVKYRRNISPPGNKISPGFYAAEDRRKHNELMRPLLSNNPPPANSNIPDMILAPNAIEHRLVVAQLLDCIKSTHQLSYPEEKA